MSLISVLTFPLPATVIKPRDPAILFIRHPETAVNREKRFRGRMDVPPDKKGIQESLKIAQGLKNEKIKIIYCSDMQRSRALAHAIKKYHPETPLSISKKFGPWDIGILQGLEIGHYAIVYNAHAADKESRIAWGEPITDFHKRWFGALSEIFKEAELDSIIPEDPGRIICITHHHNLLVIPNYLDPMKMCFIDGPPYPGQSVLMQKKNGQWKWPLKGIYRQPAGGQGS